jgi:luciferase family oxidoreductase group 1
MMQAVEIYRTRFQPSEQLDRPHAMVGVNVVAAESDREARRLFTSAQQQFVNLRRGTPGKLAPPIDDIDDYATPMERAGIDQALACAVVGSPETVRRGLAAFIDRTGADELIIAGHIYDHTARLRSYEIAADVHRQLVTAPAEASAA